MHRRQRARGLAALALAAGAVLALPGAAAASVATVSFKPEADAYVSSSYPTTSFGTSTAMAVDGSPRKQTFLRFDVQGLNGRTVVDARLRLYQSDASDSGGRVFTASSTSWDESITWNTKPAIDGIQLGQFGTVANGSSYEIALGDSVQSDGPVTLALDSTSADEARWATRESTKPPPRLILRVESGDAITDGLTQVAGPNGGAADPTSFSLQHRLAITDSGRLLSVYVPHRAGPQLAWRDPAGNWQTQSTGASDRGSLLTGIASGVNPASIVVGKDSTGNERAWVVFGASSSSSTIPIYLRRLSNLDSPDGPKLGPLVVLAPGGGSKPDVQLVRKESGVTKAVVLWSRPGGSGTYELQSAWLEDLDSETPEISHRTMLSSSTSSKLWGTLASANGTVQAIARTGGRLVSFMHEPSEPPESWALRANGVSASGYGYHSAVSLESGKTLVAVESNATDHVVKVQRFLADNTASAAELALSGYAMPSLTTDGTSAWLVMIRRSDGYVVSRQFTPGSGWSTIDEVEIGAEGGGNYSAPSLLGQADGRLRLIVRGPAGSTVGANGVLAYQRPLFPAFGFAE